VTGDLINVFALSLVAMFNPSLLAALTVMLLLPHPKRLMLGYLLGAYTTSITVGLVIVFALPGSGTERTSKHRIGPIEDIVIGVLLWVIAFALWTGRVQSFRERRRQRKEAKLKARENAGKPTESLPLRMLRKADPRVTFVVGAVVSFPGVSYLDALDHIHKLNSGVVATILLVVYFCAAQQIVLELPLLGYVFAPERTRDDVARFRHWIARRGGTAAEIIATALGVWLVTRGVITLL
jgi:hypothetical protein